MDSDFFEAFVNAAKNGRTPGTDYFGKGNGDESTVVVPDNPAGKFSTQGGEIVEKEAINDSGHVFKCAQGLGQSPKFSVYQKMRGDCIIGGVFREQVFTKVFTQVTGEVTNPADAMDISAVGILPTGCRPVDVTLPEYCGAGLSGKGVVIIGKRVNLCVHPVGIGIDVAEFVLDAVPLFPELGGLNKYVCDQVKVDVSVFLFFRSPNVMDHAVLFPEFGEKLIEQAGFDDLVGMALGTTQCERDERYPESYPAMGFPVVRFFGFGKEK